MTYSISHPVRPMARARAIAALALVVTLGAARPAAAFCGFYVTGADSQLYANATMVVLMRDGTRTVLSMQNNYQGPPDAFALVIPVPTVLQKEQVKVLPKEVFQKVDALGAPRLVEYWEVDPCRPQNNDFATRGGAPTSAPAPVASAAGNAAPAVRIEAQFTVGEYDVVVLSADDSSALDTWLRDNKYNIPSGAAPVLAPYVASGMKFFVAKVDPARVTFNGNQAVLSPLRFYYDTQDFSLPVRLGLLNSSGSQDLIVNILANQRYEVTNYPNVTVPTNIRVQNDVRNGFASFYEALYARVLDQHPRAVVTEYSWTASGCDPCPTPSAPLTPQDIATLGGDVLQMQVTPTGQQPAAGSGALIPIQPNPIFYQMTLTRLHARYSKDSLGEDLMFKQAAGIIGGRGVPDTQGMLDQSVQPSSINNFQGRYVILHPWEGALSCQTPQRGYWGGPSGGPGSPPMTQAPSNAALTGAAPKAGDLPALVAESIPSLSVTATTPLNPLAKPAPAAGSSGDKAPAGGTGGKAPASGTGGKTAAAAGGKDAPAGAAGKASAAASSGAGATAQDSPAAPTAASPSPTASSHKSSCAVSAPRAGHGFALAFYGVGLATLALKRRARRHRA